VRIRLLDTDRQQALAEVMPDLGLKLNAGFKR
jgi:hypothetical protein